MTWRPGGASRPEVYAMKPKLSALAILLAGCCWPVVASATTFNFFWTGNPAQDHTIVASNDFALRATGTIEINASAGSAFTLADIVSTNIHVSGSSITAFTFTQWTNAGGTISADGLSATFNATGNPFSHPSTDFFGCHSPGCGGNFDIAVSNNPSVVLQEVTYGSASNALASMHMMAAPPTTPLPAALPLFATGAGAIGLLAFRRKRKAGATGA